MCVENLENIYVVFAIAIRYYNVDALVPDRKESVLVVLPSKFPPHAEALEGTPRTTPQEDRDKNFHTRLGHTDTQVI